MQRRTLLAAVGTTGAAGLLGVGGLGYTLLSRCGPGETPIEDIEDNQDEDVTVKGEVLNVRKDQNIFTIGDGTGKAYVSVLGNNYPTLRRCVTVKAGVGSCVGCGETVYLDPAEWTYSAW